MDALKRVLLGWLAVAMWAVGLSGPALASDAPVVARVALMVGEVYRASGSLAGRPLSLGAELREADSIATGPSGMAVLVFADQTRMSVRPNSELVIRRFRVDPAGVQTQVHIELLRGVVRQISGEAIQAQPDRYRLNTPIAVIGVRGTDFIAKVGPAALEAYVHEGAIIVHAPAAATETKVDGLQRPWLAITASDAAPYAVVRSNGVIERRSVTAEDLEAIFGLRIAAAAKASTASAAEAEPAGPADKGKAGSAAPIQRASAAADGKALAWAGAVSDGAPVRELVGLETLSGQTPPATGTKNDPPPPAVALPQQLVWGRFSSARDLPWQLLIPYSEASQGRHPVVGELGQFALWRVNPNHGLERDLRGRVEFALAAADALLLQDTQALRTRVSNPVLAVDFDRMQFQTQLTLQAEGQAAQKLQATGTVNTDGILLSLQPEQKVAGGLSANGREAGYYFNLQAREGLYQGMTLWTAR